MVVRVRSGMGWGCVGCGEDALEKSQCSNVVVTFGGGEEDCSEREDEVAVRWCAW